MQRQLVVPIYSAAIQAAEAGAFYATHVSDLGNDGPCRRAAYLRRKTGLRFSLNAARPSAAYSVAKQIVCSCRSYSIAFSSGIETAAFRFALAVAVPRYNDTAMARARAISSPCGTTSLTSPHARPFLR